MTNHYQKNISFYTELLSKHGTDVRSLNWGSKESQGARFAVLSGIGDFDNCSLLDVGCGLGDLYAWLSAQNKTVQYRGIDITPEMINTAKSRFPDAQFNVSPVEQLSETEKYDYIVASGIFYLVEQEPFEFMKNTVSRMFSLCNKGVAFNSLSNWADEKEAGEFYASPAEVLDFCHSLTTFVTLRHDYHPADFTVYLHKSKPNK